MKLINIEDLLNAKIPLPTEEEFSTDNMMDFLCGMEWVGKYVKEKMPTVELIRCKDCGWYKLDCESCGFWPDEGYRDPMHYCGEGKPREEP